MWGQFGAGACGYFVCCRLMSSLGVTRTHVEMSLTPNLSCLCWTVLSFDFQKYVNLFILLYNQNRHVAKSWFIFEVRWKKLPPDSPPLCVCWKTFSFLDVALLLQSVCLCVCMVCACLRVTQCTHLARECLNLSSILCESKCVRKQREQLAHISEFYFLLQCHYIEYHKWL